MRMVGLEEKLYGKNNIVNKETGEKATSSRGWIKEGGYTPEYYEVVRSNGEREVWCFSKYHEDWLVHPWDRIWTYSLNVFDPSFPEGTIEEQRRDRPVGKELQKEIEELEKYLRDNGRLRDCGCGEKFEELEKFEYDSPDECWKFMYGRGGIGYYCRRCGKYPNFIELRLN